jgi:hypothetical protein
MSDNPRAFPVPWEFHEAEAGMSLRDYFAGQALIGLAMKDPYENPDRHAVLAYAKADAMLDARKKG